MWGESWTGDDGTVVVDLQGSWEEFGVTTGGDTLITYRGGEVSRKEFVEHTPSSHGLLELARWRLGRLKERFLP